MTRNGYLRMRQASEAGLISEILRVLASEAKEARSQAGVRASRVAAIGRSGESRGEWVRRVQRERDRNARPI
jgi:hypothetical protein